MYRSTHVSRSDNLCYRSQYSDRVEETYSRSTRRCSLVWTCRPLQRQILAVPMSVHWVAACRSCSMRQRHRRFMVPIYSVGQFVLNGWSSVPVHDYSFNAVAENNEGLYTTNGRLPRLVKNNQTVHLIQYQKILQWMNSRVSLVYSMNESQTVGIVSANRKWNLASLRSRYILRGF